MKYLGTILDNKLKFSEHISYAAQWCTKLIHNLFKSAKTTWALKHEAMKAIYKEATLSLLLYGAPVWSAAMKYEYNKQKCIRVQRLMNIKVAKAFRTSTETLCTLAGTTPIINKTEEVVKKYNVRKEKGCQTQLIDRKLELKKWPHHGDAVKIIEVDEYKDQAFRT